MTELPSGQRTRENLLAAIDSITYAIRTLAECGRMIAGLLLLAAVSAGSTEPRLLNDGELFTSDDYPIDARTQQAQGAVKVRVSVDPNGLVTNCVIEKQSGNASLDAQTCDVIRARARFQPATDNAGRHVAGKWHYAVQWRYRQDQFRPILQPDKFQLRVTANANGKLTSCHAEMEENGKPAETPPTFDDCVEVVSSYGPGLLTLLDHEPGTQARAILLDVRTYVGTIPTELPSRNEPVESLIFQAIGRYYVTAEGRVVRCATQIIRDTAPNATPKELNCPGLLKAHFVPWRDAANRPAATEVATVTTIYLQGVGAVE